MAEAKPRKPVDRRKPLDRQLAVSALQAHHRSTQLTSIGSYQRWAEGLDVPCGWRIMRTFGSWAEATRAAGLDNAPQGRPLNWSSERIDQALIAAWPAIEAAGEPIQRKTISAALRASGGPSLSTVTRTESLAHRIARLRACNALPAI